MQMRIALLAIAITLVLLGALWLIPRDDLSRDTVRPIDVPWIVTAHDDGSSEVLGLNLGQATLNDAIERFGSPESIALFLARDGSSSLEAYFGNVQLAPMMKVKLVATLSADEALLDQFTANAIDRAGTREGDAKLLLAEADKDALGTLPLAGLTCIPGYTGLESDFFRERLGAPAATRVETDHAVSWFYPELGLSLVIDAEGAEVFEYVPPRDFVLPADAENPEG